MKKLKMPISYNSSVIGYIAYVIIFQIADYNPLRDRQFSLVISTHFIHNRTEYKITINCIHSLCVCVCVCVSVCMHVYVNVEKIKVSIFPYIGMYVHVQVLGPQIKYSYFCGITVQQV